MKIVSLPQLNEDAKEIQECVQKAYDSLMNLQPHIAGLLGKDERKFIDSHVDVAMDYLKKVIE